MRRKVSGLLALTVMTGALPIVVLSNAWAAQPSCYAYKEYQNNNNGLDPNRGLGNCTAIDSSTKARIKLVRSGQIDLASSWFTATNVTYYTAWATCPYGCSGGYEWAPR